MLPISEFHFAFCGIFAATLGYACARRAALLLLNSNSKPDVEADPEERSLKRKLVEEHDVDTARPMKRNKTPDEDVFSLTEISQHAPSYQQPGEPVHDIATPPQESFCTEQDVTPAREPTPPPHPRTEVDATRASTSQVDPSPTPTRPSTPVKPLKSTNAFSAFSGSSSPFASCSNASGPSSSDTTPAWRRQNDSESDVFGQVTSANVLAPSPDDALSPQPLQINHVQSLVKLPTCLTGEENEIVEADLKGVKLFTKRGRKEFTDGMYGHIKILTQQSTSNEDPQPTEGETSSQTRLLFRRDPLGQVSMNVGLHPTVRCHFDAGENILRVILMEKLTDGQEDVVIYALKPGRAGKADFQSFTKTLCDHEGLKSRVVTDSAAPGDAAAS